MLQLKIVKGPGAGAKSYPLAIGRALVLGRGTDCDVQLAGTGVSKRHARLTTLAGSKVEVEDMGSSNGTFVNGFLVKKHILRPGDTLVIHPFVLQVDIAAPEPVGAPSGFSQASSASGGFGSSGFATDAQTIDVSATTPSDAPLGQKVKDFFATNIFPLADSLSGQFDVRLLVGAFFALWSLLIVLFTATPFSERANEKVVNESIEVAKLYARQLVRLNQQAILEQRYRDLIAELDARKGQTPRVIRSMILDSAKAQILAPAELLGRPVPSNFAANALTYGDLRVQMDKEGIAYVSAPIKFHDADRNEDTIAAVVLIEYDAASARFTLANILDQALNSFLYALLATILFMIFVYRWTDGTIESVTGRIEDAIRKGDIQVLSPVKWPAVAQLCDKVSVLLGRAASGGGGGGSAMNGGSKDWAPAAVQASGAAAAAFDANLVVLGWNESMERVIGIRASMAVGSDISGASRDVAFESGVRSLAGQAATLVGQVVAQPIEFSGRPYRMRMVYTDGAYFLTVTEET